MFKTGKVYDTDAIKKGNLATVVIYSDNKETMINGLVVGVTPMNLRLVVYNPKPGKSTVIKDIPIDWIESGKAEVVVEDSLPRRKMH